MTIDPIQTNISKLGRLDLFLKLSEIKSFHEIKKQINEAYIKKMKTTDNKS